jgi:hypothetical protein
MWVLSVAEQRYPAVLAVIGEGQTVTDVAARWRCHGRCIGGWAARIRRSSRLSIES